MDLFYFCNLRGVLSKLYLLSSFISLIMDCSAKNCSLLENKVFCGCSFPFCYFLSCLFLLFPKSLVIIKCLTGYLDG